MPAMLRSEFEQKPTTHISTVEGGGTGALGVNGQNPIRDLVVGWRSYCTGGNLIEEGYLSRNGGCNSEEVDEAGMHSDCKVNLKNIFLIARVAKGKTIAFARSESSVKGLEWCWNAWPHDHI